MLADDDINLHVVDLPRLKEKHIEEMLIHSALHYKSTYMREVEDMTSILDKSQTIKSVEKGQEVRNHLYDKWQLHNVIRQIDEKVIKIIHRQCRGNPYLSLQYFVNMLQNDYLEVGPLGHVFPTAQFEKSYETGNWSSLPVPRHVCRGIQ